MGISYENQSVNYDKITRRYKEYLALYMIFNNGSSEGCADFAEFYWRMTWLTKYDRDRAIGQQGY
jgi:hypothetical protein